MSPVPRLCVVGPMIGRNPGRVTTQGERLADFFKTLGFSVIEVSSAQNRYIRLADIIQSLVRRRREFDIVVLQVFGGRSFVVEDIASWIASRLGTRVIMVLRGGAGPVFMSDFPRWTCRVLDRADCLVTPSRFLARAVLPLGYSAEVIPNVIDLSAYSCRARSVISPRLLWMRAFHEIYNPALAIRALLRVKAAYPAATLVMAGANLGLEPEMRLHAEACGVASSVRFAGFLDPAAKRREFDSADVFLNTNRIDNMPVSVIEAAASGLPVVATRVGGISDLLTDGENALLVRDDDESAFAEAICRLLRDPALVERLSGAALRIAKASAKDEVMPRWEALIDRVASKTLAGAS